MTTIALTEADLEQELDRVRALRATLVIRHAFFASILLPMRILPSLTLPTFAATNCHDTIWFNPMWTRGLTLKQLGYVLLHETGHTVLLHALRRGHRDRDFWGIAADLADNAMIDEVRDANGAPLYERPEQVHVPGIGTCSLLTADWAKDLASEEIYERLEKDGGIAPTNGGGLTGQEGRGAPRQPNSSDKRQNDSQQPDSGEIQGGSTEPNWSRIPCRPGETCVQVPSPLTEDQAERLTDRVVAAHEAWVASQQRGTMPASLLRLIERLRRAKVPWQRILHQYAGTALAKEDFSLFPPHKRWLSESDLIRPSMRSPSLGALAVSVDTSASISQALLQAFAAEVAKLATLSEETLLLTHDAAVHQVIRTSELPHFLKTLDFKGGGGTSHIPVFDFLREHRLHPDLFIALTDLYSEYPTDKPRFPVLWTTTEEHGSPPPWGRVIVIPESADM